MNLTKEIQVAVDAVRAAAGVCQAVQKQLVNANTIQKKDRSPVTVADYAAQAVVCAKLADVFANDPVVGEEDAGELRSTENAAVRALVAQYAGAGLNRSLSEAEMLSFIDRGGSAGYAQGKTKRFWTLDPIDGTKGFLRGEQYAVALALIEDGQVTVGVLACPNLPSARGHGTLLVARKAEGMFQLALDATDYDAERLGVSQPVSLPDARFCESVESGHSDHSQSAKIAELLGITREPLRMDSQAKYAAVARGEAQIYLRLPTRADYREKIWDHAAGMLVVQEAGGTVTDVTGKPLDFTLGRQLENNSGVVATVGGVHTSVIHAVSRVL